MTDSLTVVFRPLNWNICGNQYSKIFWIFWILDVIYKIVKTNLVSVHKTHIKNRGTYDPNVQRKNVSHPSGTTYKRLNYDCFFLTVNILTFTDNTEFIKYKRTELDNDDVHQR